MFENNRVKFYMQTEVSELREQEGKVSDGLGLPVASPRATIPFTSGVLVSLLSCALKFMLLDLTLRNKCQCGVASLLLLTSCCFSKELWSICILQRR